MAKKIALSDLEPGMIIVKPITMKNGMVILGEGVELTQSWVERVQGMDIDGVYIDAPEEQKVTKEEAIVQLDSRFQPVADRPYMIRLKAILREHIEGLYEK
ncbi:MAG: hypothetical protein NTV58_11185 [Deltaproteobacteria bacterium]|nr:hypothetical protein [Deltaproteobacteria bacterium]